MRPKPDSPEPPNGSAGTAANARAEFTDVMPDRSARAAFMPARRRLVNTDDPMFAALSLPLPAQQLDKPVAPEDLVDIKIAAEKSYAAQTSTIDDTERALRVLVGGSHSANAEGATAQVLVLRCVNDHDLYTKLEKVYVSAEQSADKIIHDLEAHANSAASTAQALQDLQGQLDATLRREAELRASPDPASAEDLEEQQQIEKKLLEAITVYRAIPGSDDSVQADRMRALKVKFSLLGQDAADLVKIAAIKCIAERKVLNFLDQRDQREKQIASWTELLPSASTQDRPAKQPGRRPSSASVKQQESIP